MHFNMYQDRGRGEVFLPIVDQHAGESDGRAPEDEGHHDLTERDWTQLTQPTFSAQSDSAE